MFVVLRRKTVIAVSIILLTIAIAAIVITLVTDSATGAAGEYSHTVVLDAGHGGVDVGVKGVKTGNKESDVNLKITLLVAERLEGAGIKPVLTRTDENGLYGEDLNNFKRRDMEARRDIIANTAPSLVLSIHCNKFPDSSRRGAQCFFEPTSENSIALARALQTALNPINENAVGRTFDALKGDYYMLKCSTFPSAIAECGFLSNAEDDALLATDSYLATLSDALVVGIKSFLALA